MDLSAPQSLMGEWDCSLHHSHCWKPLVQQRFLRKVPPHMSCSSSVFSSRCSLAMSSECADILASTRMSWECPTAPVAVRTLPAQDRSPPARHRTSPVRDSRPSGHLTHWCTPLPLRFRVRNPVFRPHRAWSAALAVGTCPHTQAQSYTYVPDRTLTSLHETRAHTH